MFYNKYGMLISSFDIKNPHHHQCTQTMVWVVTSKSCENAYHYNGKLKYMKIYYNTKYNESRLLFQEKWVGMIKKG